MSLRIASNTTARSCALALLLTTSTVSIVLAAEPGNKYHRRDLVSDGGVPAEHTDVDLVNGWGLAASAAGPWWVNAADAGKSLLYNGEGVKNPLIVTVPGAPTGIVFSGGAGFAVPGAGPARFIFASEDGSISAWSPTLVPNTAAVVVIPSTGDASYKGLANYQKKNSK